MSALHRNNVSTTLNGAITAGQTSITVTDGSEMPLPTGGDYFTLTLDDQAGVEEILHCTARSGNVLTVSRANEGTSDLNWPDLSLIELRLTAATIDSKITELLDDASPELSNNLDANGEEILDLLRLRTQLVCYRTDTTNNIEFTNSRQTFKPFNVDVMNLTTSGLQLGGADSRVNKILDQDNMSSDSAVALCTQQSIKAYVDNQIGVLDQERVRAWIQFDSIGAVSVQESHNVASISDDGIGEFTITFTVPFVNNTYALSGMAKQNVTNKVAVVTEGPAGATPSSVHIHTVDNNGLNDFDDVSCMVVGTI
jgi:hypothetical protein